jgi:hypothetical protein
MAVKVSSKGAALQLSISSVFTSIASLDTLNAPAAKVQTVDTTCLDSPVGMEHKPTGWVDGGACSGSGFLDPVEATHKALTALIAAPLISQWKVKWSDIAATVWPFNGTLDEFAPTAKVGDFLRFTFNITLDGITTYP